MYPALKGKLKGNGLKPSRFLYDDYVPTDGKVCVVECYMKEKINGRQILSGSCSSQLYRQSYAMDKDNRTQAFHRGSLRCR